MRILGIDPGLADIGWGVVDFQSQRFQPVSYGVVRTKPSEDLQTRIMEVVSAISGIAGQYKVDCAAMEEIFFTGHSKTSAMNVSKVIGAVLCELGRMGVPCRLFSPVQIKSSITGYGQAEKKQVQEMAKIILGLKEIPRPDHAADALSAAICLGHFGATEARIGG
ncbi:MAG: crossover junction endodeoxyribonuclease RuvC [Spirochaetales bacterium]|nr:crossover junction endodeoxyribonuclease RuvC [Spirochaetales bacterium]